MNSPEGHTKKGIQLKTKIFLKHSMFITKTTCLSMDVVTNVRCSTAKLPGTAQHLGTIKTGVPGCPRLSPTLDSGVNHPGKAGAILLTWR